MNEGQVVSASSLTLTSFLSSGSCGLELNLLPSLSPLHSPAWADVTLPGSNMAIP